MDIIANKLKKIIENIHLNSNNFDKFTNYIQDKDNLKIFNDFFTYLNLYFNKKYTINTRKILGYYTIFFFPNIVNIDKQNKILKDLYKTGNSIKLYLSILVIQCGNFCKKNNNNNLEKNFEIFSRKHEEFILYFNLWKKIDKDNLVINLTYNYIELEQNQTELNNKYELALINEKEFHSINDTLLIQQRELRRTIKKIDGLDIFAYYYEEYLFEKKIKNKIEFNMRMAYWDKFEEELNNNKTNMLVIVLEELITNLCNCIPNREDIHHEIRETIDRELLIQMIEQKVFYKDDFLKISKYIIHLLKLFQCASEDKNTIKFEEELEKKINNNEKLEYIVRYFLEYIFEKLSNIINLKYLFT